MIWFDLICDLNKSQVSVGYLTLLLNEYGPVNNRFLVDILPKYVAWLLRQQWNACSQPVAPSSDQGGLGWRLSMIMCMITCVRRLLFYLLLSFFYSLYWLCYRESFRISEIQIWLDYYLIWPSDRTVEALVFRMEKMQKTIDGHMRDDLCWCVLFYLLLSFYSLTDCVIAENFKISGT